MVKILKIIGRLVGIPLEWLLIFVIIFLFAIRTSSFQTYLAQKVAAYFSDELHTKVSLGKVDIVFFDQLYLDKLLILDLQKDTLLSLNTIGVKFNNLTIFGNKIKIKDVELVDGTMKVSKSAKTKIFNFQFLVDYFKSDKPSSPSDPFELAIQKVSVKNLAIHYHDLTKKRTPTFFNENHLDLTSLNFVLQDIKNNKEGLSLLINDLRAKESCGLDLKNLSGKLTVKANSIDLSKVNIALNDSKLAASIIGIDWKNDADLEDFTDKVLWKIKLQPSSIMLSDIAYFVPEMVGMKNRIGLQGDASNTLSHLFLKGIKLEYAKNTRIYADLELPNFNDLSAYDFHEKIITATLDMNELKKFILPDPLGNLNLGKEINQLGLVRLANMNISGIHGDFNIGSTTIKTKIGDATILQAIRLVNGINFEIIPLIKDKPSISLRKFDLGEMLLLDEIGIVDGDVGFSNFSLKEKGVEVLGIAATFNQLDVLDYSYMNVDVSAAKVSEDIFEGKINIDDKNLGLDYSGKIGFGKNAFYDMALKVNKANLDLLGFIPSSQSEVTGDFSINVSGDKLSNFSGEISCNDFFYQDNDNSLSVPTINLSVERSEAADIMKLTSSFANVEIIGKINPETVVDDFVFELAKAVPSLGVNLKGKQSGMASIFSYSITTKNLDSLFSIFIPGLTIAEGTTLKGYFNSENESLKLDALSDNVTYNNLVFDGINISQTLSSVGLDAEYKVAKFILDDSIQFNQVNFKSDGKGGILNSKLIWDPNSNNYSNIAWQTTVYADNNLAFNLTPSFFSINDVQWEILNESIIKLSNSELDFENLKIQRIDQKITIDGKISDRESENLQIFFTKIDLAEISQLLKLDVQLSGLFSGNGTIANSINGYKYSVMAGITQLKINNEEVGDIKFNTNYDSESESIQLDGNLKYRSLPTLEFVGAYFLKRERDKLDMALKFNNTDLSFVNGFLDPAVIKGIAGKLSGNIAVKGSVNAPELSGELNLQNVTAKVELLGVRYALNGKVKIFKDEIHLDNIPVKDEDGNVASLVGQIYHTNFDKWNYDLNFDFEGDDQAKNNKFNPNYVKSNRFLLLNTKYKEGDYYYGKAYGKGSANIAGYGSKMAVDVLVETTNGSQINFPMYGVSTIDEEDELVHFVSKNDPLAELIKDKIDFTGVNLNMKFKLSPDTELKIIFNEQLGDEITAFGNGDIILKLDAFNNINMEGTYTIQKGSKYNFAMGPLKQTFDIQQGSKITWTGDVEKANIDLITSFTIKKVNLLDLSPELVDKSLANQDVNCLLKLSENLVEPKIKFEIQSPNATETGKSLISRVNAENDELNRQFFSLLLVKKFQPIKGAVSASSSAALDLVESQINGLLGQLSKEYKVNVDIGSSNAMASVQKNFLNDRLVITGSFGVENNATSGQATSGFVGDVSIDYLVNQKGTLRVNAFNKSNSNTVDESSGPFTQGAGLSYHEEFNNMGDFELYQSFMDVFRPKDKKYFKNRRKKKQTKLPPLVIDNGNSPVIKTDE
jgi:hypothetical protein